MSGRVLVSGEREQFHPILCKIGAQIGLDQLKLGDLGDSWPPFSPKMSWPLNHQVSNLVG